MKTRRLTLAIGILGGGASDTTGPACAITSAASTITAAAFSVTITFTNPETSAVEAVTGFTLGDITCSANASAGTLANPSTGVYTATITPTATGTVTVDVAGGVCTDASNNPNTAATQFSVLYIASLGWFKSGVGTYQDAGGTTPATANSDPVRLWQDQSGTGNHLTAATDGKRPTLVTNLLNSLPSTRFTVAAQSAVTRSYTLAQPFSLVMLVNAKTNSGEIFPSGVATAGVFRGVTNWAITAGTGRLTTHPCYGSTVVSAVFNGASSVLRINEVAEALGGTIGTNGLTALTIGSAGNHETMDGTEFILLSGAISEATLALVESYLASKFDMQYFLAIGDSKSAHTNQWWQAPLRSGLETSTLKPWSEYIPIATAGWTTQNVKDNIDAQLATWTKTPTYIFIALGTNDVSAGVLPNEATWKANTTYIVDACRTKWPGVPVYLSHTWRRNANSECATLKTWRNQVIATYPSGVAAGDDETVWLENGDDGVTYSSDGVHYSTAGVTQKATVLQAAL